MIDHLPSVMQVEVASRPLRIAIVYSRLPFPMMRGDQLTVAHLLSFLSARGHQVSFFVTQSDETMSDGQIAWLNGACRDVRIYPHGPVRQAAGAIRGVLLGKPIQVGMFNSSALKRDLGIRVQRGDYDVVYVYYLRSAEALPDGFGPEAHVHRDGHPVASFLAMQLSQTLNTNRMLRNRTGLLKKLLYFVEWKLLRRYEARIWRRFTRTVLIGPKDLEAIKTECRQQRVREIDNYVYGAHGTDVRRFRQASPEEVVPGRLIFSGAMQYVPNVQALLWFVENCWPEIRHRYPDAELFVQGRDPVSQIRKLHGRNGVFVTGTVADVSVFIRSAAICINPMLAAGGMQNKLIEYLASGKAIVATSIANEGIGAQAGEHLLLADSAKAFTASVLELLDDGQLRQRLGRAARQFAMDSWSWEAHFLKLEKHFYRSLTDIEGY